MLFNPQMQVTAAFTSTQMRRTYSKTDFEEVFLDAAYCLDAPDFLPCGNVVAAKVDTKSFYVR